MDMDSQSSGANHRAGKAYPRGGQNLKPTEPQGVTQPGLDGPHRRAQATAQAWAAAAVF